MPTRVDELREAASALEAWQQARRFKLPNKGRDIAVTLKFGSELPPALCDAVAGQIPAMLPQLVGIAVANLRERARAACVAAGIEFVEE